VGNKNMSFGMDFGADRKRQELLELLRQMGMGGPQGSSPAQTPSRLPVTTIGGRAGPSASFSALLNPRRPLANLAPR
jgi:hypothetical protein